MALLGALQSRVFEHYWHSVAYRQGVRVFKAPSEIPKVLKNHAKLNPMVKTVKNC